MILEMTNEEDTTRGDGPRVRKHIHVSKVSSYDTDGVQEPTRHAERHQQRTSQEMLARAPTVDTLQDTQVQQNVLVEVNPESLGGQMGWNSNTQVS